MTNSTPAAIQLLESGAWWVQEASISTAASDRGGYMTTVTLTLVGNGEDIVTITFEGVRDLSLEQSTSNFALGRTEVFDLRDRGWEDRYKLHSGQHGALTLIFNSATVVTSA